ncbi:MAG: hypothetical protein ACLRUY_01945 [Faecalibacterium prausnitzii]
MQAIRSNPATASLAYDDGMQDIAKANLDAELKGSFRGYKGYHNVKIDREKSTLTLIAQYDYKDTTLEKLIGYITKNNEASNLNFNLSSKWTKIGVAAKTHKGQTYIAITLQVKKT